METIHVNQVKLVRRITSNSSTLPLKFFLATILTMHLHLIVKCDHAYSATFTIL